MRKSNRGGKGGYLERILFFYQFEDNQSSKIFASLRDHNCQTSGKTQTKSTVMAWGDTTTTRTTLTVSKQPKVTEDP
ncbi:hypothetical protein E2C01_015329 [Portunus trituberculatus]|uniref:Uncharacterized protein n=1 Tax=Portunus trituberculatus TaxID=210409 RepID=A0A5B7DLJ5_PORTR|nr:hypothetical protein [Portunus trituberculatus]